MLVLLLHFSCSRTMRWVWVRNRLVWIRCEGQSKIQMHILLNCHTLTNTHRLDCVHFGKKSGCLSASFTLFGVWFELRFIGRMIWAQFGMWKCAYCSALEMVWTKLCSHFHSNGIYFVVSSCLDIIHEEAIQFFSTISAVSCMKCQKKTYAIERDAFVVCSSKPQSHF